MKGHPFREVILFLVVAMGLLIPMAQLKSVSSSHLQHTHDADHLGTSEEEKGHVDAFAELLLSHKAESVSLSVAGQVILEEQQVLRTDLEVCLPFEGTSVEVIIVWSDPGEGRPYAELRMEPENRADLVYSFWGRKGENLKRWYVRPGEAP